MKQEATTLKIDLKDNCQNNNYKVGYTKVENKKTNKILEVIIIYNKQQMTEGSWSWEVKQCNG